MPVRRSRPRAALALLLAALVGAPSIARAQASSSVVARATVASARTPRLALSVAEAPILTARAAGASARTTDGSVLVTTAVRVAGNTGYRLFVRARTVAAGAGISVRDASGTFRSLAGGAAVEVARGREGDEVRDVVHRVDRSASVLPVVYELVYDPVS
ncbi:MAG TPA: hypothetical protein VFZ11_00900 [Gemmatimonadaceae bacterium]